MKKNVFEKTCQKARIKKESLCNTVFTKQFRGSGSMEKITKNINVRFIGDEEVVNFAILCLKGSLETNIEMRRMENNNINIIEAKITNI